MERSSNFITVVSVIVAIVLVTIGVLFMMGRMPYCECGYVKFWHGERISSENSQHLTDPYTFSHIMHGFGFYFLLWLIAKRLPVRQRMVAAMLLEAIWEVLENTDFVINRYRTVTVSLDYYGDSILNSVGDILAAIFGFLLAARLPVWVSIAIFALLEVLLLMLVRDSLLLNIIMLIYPIEAIKNWQLSG